MKDSIKIGKEIFNQLKSKGRKIGGTGILPKGVFDYMIKEKLGLEPDEYMIIDSDWEGKDLPGGVGDYSGKILTKDGRIYAFWTGWDPERISPDGSKGWYTLGENFKDPVTGEAHPLFYEIIDSKIYQSSMIELKKWKSFDS